MTGNSCIDVRFFAPPADLAPCFTTFYRLEVNLDEGQQLEDWLQMDKPVNIPGTFMEYPNWRRKLSRNLESIFADEDIQSLAAGINAGRQEAGRQHNDR